MQNHYFQAFSLNMLMNQYFNRVFPSIMIKKQMKIYRNGIFQQISKADQIFHFKWKIRVFALQGILTCPKAPI